MSSRELRRERARLLHARAVEHYNRGRPAPARAALTRAQQLLGDDDPGHVAVGGLLVRVWMTEALCEAELVGVESARRVLDRAESLAQGLLDQRLLMMLNSNRGLVEMRGGDLTLALDALDRAMELLDHAEAHAQFTALLNRSTVHMYSGRLARSRSDLTRAVEVASTAGLRIDQFQALHNLGYLEFLSGDLPLALRRMGEAGAVDTGQEWGMVHLDRARVLAEAGLIREADESLAEAARIFRRDRLAQDLAEVELERARCALVAGDAGAARRLAGRARTRFQRRGSDRWRRQAELVLLQADLAAGRPGSRLAPPALRLRGELAAEGHHLAAATAGRIAAEAYLAAGRPDEAAALLGPPAATTREPITARLHERYVRARLGAATGDTRAASQQVRSGLADLARYQAGFGSVDLQTAAAVHGRRLAELGVGVALDSGRAAAVFSAAERSRAVSTRLPAVHPPEDPVTAELLGELRQVVEQLRSTDEGAEQARTLHRRRRELERSVAARSWALAGVGTARPLATLASSRTRLDDAVMIMFVEADGLLHAVRLDATRASLHTLGPAAEVAELVRRSRADLDVLAQQHLPAALREAVGSATRRGLAALEASLLAPLGVDGRRLVIVSTGVLGQVAWGMLPSLRGVPVVVAPSASAWLTAATAERPRRRFTAACLAGPDLPRAPHEVKAIAEMWGERAEILEPTGPALARAVSRSTVLHVAAHGAHQTENPLFSTLRLADGPLFAYELDRTARVPEHVVLSACELGLATVRPGDEALGLTSVLLHLGSRSVVAGVGRVGDEASEAAMVAYHGLLASGRDSAAALAEVTADQPLPLVCFGGTVTLR